MRILSRELLFRGKDKKSGEWVVGRGVDVNWKDAYIIVPQADGTVGWCGVDEIEVEPTTICQFTGLMDKNGTKIFEGDILRIGVKDNVVVEWNNQQAKFDLKLGSNYVAGFNEFTMEFYEVIGNIFDNKELMK